MRRVQLGDEVSPSQSCSLEEFPVQQERAGTNAHHAQVVAGSIWEVWPWCEHGRGPRGQQLDLTVQIAPCSRTVERCVSMVTAATSTETRSLISRNVQHAWDAEWGTSSWRYVQGSCVGRWEIYRGFGTNIWPIKRWIWYSDDYYQQN